MPIKRGAATLGAGAPLVLDVVGWGWRAGPASEID